MHHSQSVFLKVVSEFEAKQEAALKYNRLKSRQALPLLAKVNMTLSKIREAFDYKNEDNTYNKYYVSFSGGRDSMVLNDLVQIVAKEKGADVPVVFCDTGIEWPSVRAIGKKYADVILKPKKSFVRVIKEHGYPVISKDVAQKLYDIQNTNSYTLLINRLNGDEKGNGKLPEAYRYLISSPYKISHMCCHYMKKQPFKKYEKAVGRVPFVGTMAADSRNRQTAYLSHGCNSFKVDRQISTPLGFWTHKDIKDYVELKELEVASIYGRMEHTGCVYCLFGCTHQEFVKTDIIKSVSEKLYRYAQAVGMVELEKYVGACGQPTLF